MILINLLPHREEKRRQRKRAFFVGLGASAVVGAAAIGIWYSVLQQMTAAQVSRNDFLKAEIGRLESQIKDIASLKSEIEALKARQKAVEDLQTDRNTRRSTCSTNWSSRRPKASTSARSARPARSSP